MTCTETGRWLAAHSGTCSMWLRAVEGWRRAATEGSEF